MMSRESNEQGFNVSDGFQKAIQDVIKHGYIEITSSVKAPI